MLPFIPLFFIVVLGMGMGSLNLFNVVIAQGNGSLQNEVTNDTSTSFLPQNDIQTQDSMNAEPISKTIKNNQVVVFAEDLLEIRDNLAEARVALDNGNLLELAQEIENLDNLVTVLLNPLPQNISAFEQKNQFALGNSQ